MNHPLTETMRLDEATAPARPRRWLVVFAGAAPAMHELPERGAVLIGRPDDRSVDRSQYTAVVRIDHGAVSRRHAVLHLGPPLELEDLGSHNGTRLRGERLGRGSRAPLLPGEFFTVGGVDCVIETSRPHAPNVISDPGLLGPILESPRMQALHRLLERVAASNMNVLLLGETGVGKEVFARELHRLSPRSAAPFLALNCATFSPELLMAELFGHERGAFTSADRARAGLLEVGNGGTVFLDEVGELPLPIQAKLLRVVEDRRIMRVGGREEKTVDVRFVAATNRDLEKEVAAGGFRADLYHRLRGFPLYLPPLRERREEILPLARHFAREAAKAQRQREPVLGPGCERALLERRWDGNIRELRQTIERAMLFATGGVILPQHLGGDSPGPENRADALPPPPVGLSEADIAERQRIVEAIERHHWIVLRAAKDLGMSRRWLTEKMKRLGIPSPRKR